MESTQYEVVNRFAPPNENDTDGYVDFVARELEYSADDRINLRNPQTRTELLKAMVQMESPDVTLTDDQIASTRLLNEDNYRALTTGKSKPGGVMKQSIRVKLCCYSNTTCFLF